MIILYGAAGIALLISFLFNKNKTGKALQLALKKILKLMPIFLILTFFIATALYFIPEELILKTLGKENLFSGVVSSSFLGSIALIPGFVVFPLCGILREQGVSYTVLSSFTTTLMMVGILTFPLERQYLGTKLALVRNLSGLLMAIIVALVTGIIFGEITL